MLDLTAMDDEINREPWLSYQKLLDYKKASTNLSANEELWWLLRKAQTENLLYFHQGFEKTTKLAQSKVKATTPLIISSRLNVFTGVSLTNNGNFSEAVLIFKKALKQAKNAGLHLIFIEGKQELAYARSLTELYETSLIEMQEAYVEAYALNNNFLIAVINETYGAIYGYMGEYEKSVEYYETALATYELLGYRAHIAEAIYGLASTYRYWKKYDLATEKFKLYQEKVSYTPNKQISFYASYGLGMTLAEQGRCEQALVVIEQALSLNGPIDYDGELLKRKVSCLIVQGNLTKASTALIEVKKIFKSLPEITGTKWQLEVNKITADLEYALGNVEAAYQLMNEYYQSYGQLVDKNSSARLDRIKTAMGVEQKDVEISLLQEREALQSLRISQEKMRNENQGYFIIFVLFLVFAAISLLIIQYKYNRKVLALSIKDSLSGLYNRRYIFDHMEKIISADASDKTSLSVIMVDIDDFKTLNDNYGHPFGDGVIQQIAVLGQATLRSTDVMARVGGEEFMCALSRIDEEQCKNIAQRFVDNVQAHKFNTEQGKTVTVTISVGIASLKDICHEDETFNARSLYGLADKALYLSKQKGKNQVSIYQASDSEKYNSR